MPDLPQVIDDYRKAVDALRDVLPDKVDIMRPTGRESEARDEALRDATTHFTKFGHNLDTAWRDRITSFRDAIALAAQQDQSILAHVGGLLADKLDKISVRGRTLPQLLSAWESEVDPFRAKVDHDEIAARAQDLLDGLKQVHAEAVSSMYGAELRAYVVSLIEHVRVRTTASSSTYRKPDTRSESLTEQMYADVSARFKTFEGWHRGVIDADSALTTGVVLLYNNSAAEVAKSYEKLRTTPTGKGDFWNQGRDRVLADKSVLPSVKGPLTVLLTNRDLARQVNETDQAFKAVVDQPKSKAAVLALREKCSVLESSLHSLMEGVVSIWPVDKSNYMTQEIPRDRLIATLLKLETFAKQTVSFGTKQAAALKW